MTPHNAGTAARHPQLCTSPVSALGRQVHLRVATSDCSAIRTQGRKISSGKRLRHNHATYLIHTMMARSTNRSNQRPDTLMQDRKTRSINPFATHGRTIHWVISGSEDRLDNPPPHAAGAPQIANNLLHRPSRRKSGHLCSTASLPATPCTSSLPTTRRTAYHCHRPVPGTREAILAS